MSVIFTSGGFLTTVQDMGRTGFQESGMSVSGVMDRRAAALANLLVGNEETEAVLEVTVMGPMMQFTEENIVAVTGGNLQPKLNGAPFPMYRAVPVHKGDSMSFGGPKTGSRACIAFAGGLDIAPVMGSRSTNLKSKIGGFKGRKIGGGDEIGFAAPKTSLPHMRSRFLVPDDYSSREQVLRVVLGPQDDCFTEQGIRTFLSETYTYTAESDRMGCRLEGEVIEHKNGGDIITDGISFGAVQVPSHGKPIIMMADHQTTGGYTKIACVISVDLPKAAQSVQGGKVRFEAVSVEEAQRLYLEERRELQALKEQWNHVPDLKGELAAAVQTAVAHEAGKYWKRAGKYRVVVDDCEYFVELDEESQGLR